MPIKFLCTCGKKIQMPDETAGRRIKCPRCAKVLTIPAESTLPASPELPAGKPVAARPAVTPAPAQAKAPPVPPAKAAAPPPPLAPPEDQLPLAEDEETLDASALEVIEEAPAPLDQLALATDPEPAHKPAPVATKPATPKSATPAKQSPAVAHTGQGTAKMAKTDEGGYDVALDALEAAAPAAAPVAAPEPGSKPAARVAPKPQPKGVADKPAKPTRGAAAGGGFSMQIAGIEFTPVKIIVLLVFLGLIGSGIWYWRSKIGNDFPVASIQTVDFVVGVDGVNWSTQKSLSGNTSSNIVEGNGERGDFEFGGGSQILVTRPNQQGDHILVKAAISQYILYDMNKVSNDDLMFSNGDFAITGPAGPITDFHFVLAPFDPKKTIDMSNTKTAKYEVLYPKGAEPKLSNTKMDDKGRVQSGVLDFDGTGGVSGRVSFESFRSDNPEFFRESISPTGVIKIKTPSGLTVTRSYGSEGLKLTLGDGAESWFTLGGYRRKVEVSPYTKFPIYLIIPRPKGDGKITIKYVSREVASFDVASVAGKTVAAAPAKDPDAPTGEPVTDYLTALGKARKVAKGTVSQSNMNQIWIMIQTYLDSHNGTWPRSFEELKKDNPDLDRLLVNVRTGDAKGYLYVRPAETRGDVKNASETVIVYEAKDGKPDPKGEVLCADGTVRKAD